MGYLSLYVQSSIKRTQKGITNPDANYTAVLALKKKYNQLLLRSKQGEAFMDDPKIPSEIKEKHAAHYTQIMEQLSNLLAQIGSYTNSEATDGFDIGKEV